MRNRRRKGTTRPHRTGRTCRSCAVGRGGLRGGILRIAPSRIHGRSGLCPGLQGGHAHTLAIFGPCLTTQDARVGLRNRGRKGTARPHRTGRTWRSCAVGRGGLRCGILRITPGRIHGRSGLCHRLRGGGGHGCIEDGIANLIAHLLKRRVFSIQRNGQLVASTDRALAGDHPVFLINI